MFKWDNKIIVTFLALCSINGNIVETQIFLSLQTLKLSVYFNSMWFWSISIIMFNFLTLKYLFTSNNNIHLKRKLEELPWWRSGWESACQCREHRFEPWSRKFPPAAEQLGPWATTTEPARLEPVLRNKRGRDSERPTHRDEEWPPLAATRESPRTETKTQHNQK